MSEVSQPACECARYSYRANIPMGFDGDDERFLATVSEVISHGKMHWWLWLGECSVCHQYWLVAQEERIFDQYLIERLNSETAMLIQTDGQWPTTFLIYEDVLRELGTRNNFPIWFDLNDSPLADTISELRDANPELALDDAAALVGIDAATYRKLKRNEARGRPSG